MKYDVFLSYNSEDRAFVARLAQELERRNCVCFVDQESLMRGQNWVSSLERALEESMAMAVCIGPHGMSGWQQREVGWALDRQTTDPKFQVMPILAPGSQPPRGFLRLLTWFDLRAGDLDPAQLDDLARVLLGADVKETAVRPSTTVCPYRGLRTFRKEDAPFFFGREKYIEDLSELVAERQLVAVVGASGSGKSSLVQAGLLPRLRVASRDHVWSVAPIVPSDRPMIALADALLHLVDPNLEGVNRVNRRLEIAAKLADRSMALRDLTTDAIKQQDASRVLLFVDQWEELYTLCTDDKAREVFVDQLLDATTHTSDLCVVLTVRSDFYSELLRRRDLLDALSRSKLDVGPMNAAELRSAIEQPATQVGLRFESGLVDRLISDASHEPGRLPLLEFTLEELWRNRDDDVMTHDAYDALGQLTGAIASRAEDVYQGLPDKLQVMAPKLFRRLVRAGGDSREDTRNRLALSALDEASRRIVEPLVEHRLLVTSGGVIRAADEVQASTDAEPEIVDDAAEQVHVEVAHEALFRSWGRLRQWIDDDRGFLQWRARLAPFREQFQHDRNSVRLRRDLLNESRRFLDSRGDELEADETDLIQRSIRTDRSWRIAICVIVFALVVSIPASLAIRWRSRTNALIDRLTTANTSQVMPLVRQFDNQGKATTWLLRRRYETLGSSSVSTARMRLALALIREDPLYRDDVLEFARLASPEQLNVLCERFDHCENLSMDATWRSVLDTATTEEQRFRLRCVLANHADPRDSRWNWSNTSHELVGQLIQRISANPNHYAPLTQLLRPVRGHLLESLKHLMLTDTNRIRQGYALSILTDYASDQPKLLVEALLASDETQFNSVFARLAEHTTVSIDVCEQVLAEAPLPGGASEADKERRAKRHANAATALLRLGATSNALALLKRQPDERTRSYLIHRVAPFGVAPSVFGQRLTETGRNTAILAGILHCLGTYPVDSLGSEERSQWPSYVAEIFSTDADPGVHSAAEWLLKQWNQSRLLGFAKRAAQETEAKRLARPASDLRRWYITPEDHTMVVIRGGDFTMGALPTDPDREANERQIEKRIDRRFALSATAVTKSQYVRFLDDRPADSADPRTYPQVKAAVLTDDSPMTSVSWYEAVAYCNWLSAQENIPEDQWCYERNAEGRFDAGMTARQGYLNLVGYRLPSDAEWEYACRAGTTTRRYFGHSDELLPKYAWYNENSQRQTWPVGSLMPNGYGLFDMLGNCWCWCQDRFHAGEQPVEDLPDTEPAVDNLGRILRGGSYINRARIIRAPFRFNDRPKRLFNFIGFRIARTHPDIESQDSESPTTNGQDNE